MNKRDVTLKVAEEMGSDVSQAACAKLVDKVFGTIREALVAGDNVRIAGLGTFKTSGRKARKGRNPQTGERIQIPARKAVSFKAAPLLKEAVNQ